MLSSQTSSKSGMTEWKSGWETMTTRLFCSDFLESLLFVFDLVTVTRSMWSLESSNRFESVWRSKFWHNKGCYSLIGFRVKIIFFWWKKEAQNLKSDNRLPYQWLQSQFRVIFSTSSISPSLYSDLCVMTKRKYTGESSLFDLCVLKCESALMVTVSLVRWSKFPIKYSGVTIMSYRHTVEK
jgi:hypothetical protein